VLAQLERIGVATIRRHLQRLAQDQPRLPQRGPEHANRLAHEIPMKRVPWDEPQPGHFEVDLVHHSGPTTTGEYVHTLQLIDVTTGWSERWAVLGRSYTVLEDAFRGVVARLPFPVLELHPDNGSEFLNAQLVRFWRTLVKDVQLSRSRPYHKNDNRFVEQKNATLVRAYLGTGRLRGPNPGAQSTVRRHVAVLQLLPARYAPDREDDPDSRGRHDRLQTAL
jgi:hypothetical protein